MYLGPRVARVFVVELLGASDLNWSAAGSGLPQTAVSEAQGDDLHLVLGHDKLPPTWWLCAGCLSV